MPNGNQSIEVTCRTLVEFCTEFIAHPYLCYTEHGLHALFFSRLYNALPPGSRYTDCNGQRLCILQKEYPTADNLGRSRRQHWDISLIRIPVEAPDCPRAFDYLPLAAVVEFGLNRGSKHLKEDIRRLCDPGANVDNRFVVHLYRLSNAANRVSRRDWTPKSDLCSRDDVQPVLRNRPVKVFYGVADATAENQSGLWIITGGGIEQVVWPRENCRS
jgi:hypothetical protein